MTEELAELERYVCWELAELERYSVYLLYWYKFGTEVQILTQRTR
jgi:hypothetical protein